MNDETTNELKAAVQWLQSLRVPGWRAYDHVDAILAHIYALRAEVEKRRSTEQELADRIAELERRMAVVLHAGPSTSLAVSVFDRAEKAEAERDALRAQVTEAVERLDEFGSAPTLADGIQAMRLRLLDYRAQVERVRTIVPYERPSYKGVPAEYVEGYNDAVRDVRDALTEP